MTESMEQPMSQEAKPESAIGKAVQGAISEVQRTKEDFWDIKQSIDARKGASGRGVYSHYVENMDKIITFMYAGKEMGFVGKVMEVTKKIGARVEAATVAFGAATLDIPYNVLTWLPRKMSPFGPPRDLFKRMALGRFDVKLGLQAVKSGFARGEMAYAKTVRTGAEAVVQAPEIAVRMAKRKVDRVVEWIKRPFEEKKQMSGKA